MSIFLLNSVIDEEIKKKGNSTTAKVVTVQVDSTQQEAILEESKKRVSAESFLMKRSLDNGKLMEALKHAANMIGQLRTGLLTPQNYYDLYITTSNELHYLQSYLSNEKDSKEKLSRLYELVQYAGNILPRLYLLITVGVLYIKTKEVPSKEILKDLVEMCKGVQHPVRGLFLRYYLSEMTKDKLPDAGSPYEGSGGDIDDCIEFLIQNFVEMNKLWVRLQHHGSVSEKSKRELERNHLRLLVGSNLSRISQLEGVNNHIYAENVLPRILDQIVTCKDQIAQQYLMECLTLVFPDEYHLCTLDKLLQTCALLQPGVNIKSIIVGLIDRLANYAQNETIPSSIQLFTFFYQNLSHVFTERPDMPLQDCLELIISLLNLSVQCYPEQMEYIDKLLSFSTEIIDKYKAQQPEITSSGPVTNQIVKLLNQPIEFYKNIITVLKLDNFPKILGTLPYETRKKVSTEILKSALQNKTKFSNAQTVDRLFEFILPLIVDQPDQPPLDELDMEDFDIEQQLVGSIIHLFDNQDLKELAAMYLTARMRFEQGGTIPARIKNTLPPLIFSALSLATNANEEIVSKRFFKFVHDTIMILKNKFPELSLNLFLNAALAASHCKFEPIAYEFLTQAFTVYEEFIRESTAQFRAIQLFIGTIQSMDCFSPDNYEAITTKTAQHSNHLLPKPDQCRAVYMCSHLFWQKKYQDGKRVLECLQKALKIASSSMETEVHLFVEILNKFLNYYINGNEAITSNFLVGLIELINTNISDRQPSDQSVVNHYRNTLQYIAYLKTQSSVRSLADVEINLP